MSDELPKWKRQSRKTVYDTKYLKLFEDSVKLPGGAIVDDYSVASLPSGVIVVATDKDNKLITMREYKYAVDDVVLNLPAGSIEQGETPIEVAKRELREESGYCSDEIELVRTLYNDYPSKMTHLIYVVRAKNATKVGQPIHEETETIGDVQLLEPGQIDSNLFNTAYIVSALALTLPEFLEK